MSGYSHQQVMHEARHEQPTCSKCNAVITDGGPTYRCAPCVEKVKRSFEDQMRAKLDALTPTSFRWATKSAPELRQRVKPPKAVDVAFGKGALEAPSVVFVGPAGAGKTSLARALWVARVVAGIRPVSRDWPADNDFDNRRVGRQAPFARFLTTYELAKCRREHRLGDGEAELIQDAMDAGILLLDELGSEAGKGDTTITEVVHERHARDLPTLYTTPYSVEEIARRYGDGVSRRVHERAVVVRLGGEGSARG